MHCGRKQVYWNKLRSGVQSASDSSCVNDTTPVRVSLLVDLLRLIRSHSTQETVCSALVAFAEIENLFQCTYRDTRCNVYLNEAKRNEELPFFFIHAASQRSDIERATVARSQLTATTVHLCLVRRLRQMRSPVPVVVKPNRA